MRVKLTALLVAVALCGAACAAEEKGLVAHYDFNEGSGETARDRSPNRNNGKIYGAQYVKCGDGYALKFDGEDDYVDCGSNASFDITGSITIEVWVKSAAVKTKDGDKGVAGKFTSDFTYGLTIDTRHSTEGQDTNFYINSGGNRVHRVGTPTGEWTHLVGTYDRQKMRLYRNGKAMTGRENIKDYSEDIDSVPGSPFCIGKNRKQYFNGLIDEVRVYNRALSEAEIQTHYQKRVNTLRAEPAAVKGPPVPATDFKLKVGENLEVLHGGKLLIAGDSLNYGEGLQTGKTDVQKKAGMTVLNTFRKDSKTLRFRREVGVNKERVEITCQFRLFPYRNTPDKSAARYTFRIPYERLKNTRFKALRGRTSRVKVVEGKLGETRGDGVIVPDARYIAFRGANLRLVIDLNPKGLSTNMDNFSGGGFIGVWRVEKKGDCVEFSFGRSARFHGGTSAGKVLIYEGDYAFEKVHAYQKYREIGGYQIDRQFFFGAPSGPEGWWRADAGAYDLGQGFGWQNPKGVHVGRTPGKSIVHSAAFGRGKHVFIRDIIPGIYAVSLRIGGVNAGPFDVALNGDVQAKGVTVKKGEVKNLHLRKYIRSDKMRIEFSSEDTWAVSTIIVQPLIYAYEDFAFDRGPWLVEDIFTPEA